MSMHANSLASWDELDPSGRRQMVLGCYRAHAEPLTDRQVMALLGFNDGNRVKPRITELIKSGQVIEIGDVLDRVTNRRVRACTNATIF